MDPKPSSGSGLGSKCRKLPGLDPEPELEDDLWRRKRVRGPEVRGSGVQVRGPRFLEVVFYFPLLHFIMFQWGKDPKPGQIRGWPLVPGPRALSKESSATQGLGKGSNWFGVFGVP